MPAKEEAVVVDEEEEKEESAFLTQITPSLSLSPSFPSLSCLSLFTTLRPEWKVTRSRRTDGRGSLWKEMFPFSHPAVNSSDGFVCGIGMS